MARQAQNGFSKFDITKSKAMRSIEDIYDSEPSAAEEPAKDETPAAKQESAEGNAPAAKQESAEQKPAEQQPCPPLTPVPSDSIAGPSSSPLNSGMPSGMKPLKAEKGVKISLPMEYYFKLVQIKACTGKSLQDLAAQGVMEFIDRFDPNRQVNEKSDL